jgi:large repetitive protein
MALNPNGSLAGTPAAAGPFSFTVTATDSAQTPQAKSQPFKLSVNPPLATPIGTPVAMLGNSAFWIPYRATPPTSSCGPTGVFVIPSGALTTAPAYVTTSANTMSLASGQNVTVDASNIVTAYSPATLIFAATDISNNIHVYGLNLLAPQTPTATQISSLSLPLAPGAALDTVICDSHGSSSNLRQPTTVFVVLHITGTMGCNTKGDVWEVVHYTDSAATAPSVVNITTTNIQELYAPSGGLAGLLLLDPVSSNLYVYANDTFTSPVTAIPGGGITSIGTDYSNNNVTAVGTAFAGTDLFLAVTKTGGAQYLYRLPYAATTATLEYTATGSLTGGVSDGTSLFFTDESGETQLIFQERLAGGNPTELYRYSYNNTPSGVQPYSLVGSNGSFLVVLENSYNDDTTGDPYSSHFATLPVGTLSANTTAVTSLEGISSAFMVETTPGTPSTALVFVNTESANGRPGPPPPNYSSEVLTPSGTVKAAPHHSAFITGTNRLSGYVLLVGNLDYGQLGTFTLSAIDLETLAATPLQIPPGLTFTGPVAVRPQLTGLSNFIGAGAFAGQGLAYDLSQHLLVPIVIANSTVAPF